MDRLLERNVLRAGSRCPASPLACPGERTDACPRRRSGTGVARRPSRTIRVTPRRPVLHEERQAPERRLPRSRGGLPRPAGDPADGTSCIASPSRPAARSTSASRGRRGTTCPATAAWRRPSWASAPIRAVTHSPLPLVQVQPNPSEQRIGVASQVANQRPDPPPLDQPAPAARLPYTASLEHQRVKIARAAHCDQGAERTELRRADAGR
jgi:hypothetical protein